MSEDDLREELVRVAWEQGMGIEFERYLLPEMLPLFAARVAAIEAGRAIEQEALRNALPALAALQERAEKAEAELEILREQKPVNFKSTLARAEKAEAERDALRADCVERGNKRTPADTPCPTCQGLTKRETYDMVCMTCGRDYLDDEPVPGTGWKRLMYAWRERAGSIGDELADVEQRVAAERTQAAAQALEEAAMWLEYLNHTLPGQAELGALTEQLYTPGNVLSALLLRHRANGISGTPAERSGWEATEVVTCPEPCICSAHQYGNCVSTCPCQWKPGTPEEITS